jgi:hypothetical protein
MKISYGVGNNDPKRWSAQWVVSSDSGNDYVVSQERANGQFQCACPGWKFRRKDCKHIQHVIKVVTAQDRAWCVFCNRPLTKARTGTECANCASRELQDRIDQATVRKNIRQNIERQLADSGRVQSQTVAEIIRESQRIADEAETARPRPKRMVILD